MKINKKGFSLAEVLIAVGIVSIIATMGFSIANKGIDRAYDLYVYSGYKGITDAIASATSNGLQLSSNANINTQPFTTHIVDLLEGKMLNEPGEQFAHFSTINGTNYIIGFSANRTVDTTTYEDYFIQMQIPSRKTSADTGRDVICLYYTQQYNQLIPYNTDNSCTSTGKGINLFERMDLLPFYLDDGTVGKISNGEYRRKTYGSFKTIFCSSNPGHRIKDLDCTGSSSAPGAMKLENPRKL